MVSFIIVIAMIGGIYLLTGHYEKRDEKFYSEMDNKSIDALIKRLEGIKKGRE